METLLNKSENARYEGGIPQVKNTAKLYLQVMREIYCNRQRRKQQRQMGGITPPGD